VYKGTVDRWFGYDNDFSAPRKIWSGEKNMKTEQMDLETEGQLALAALQRAVAKVYANGEAFIPDAQLRKKIEEAKEAKRHLFRADHAA